MKRLIYFAVIACLSLSCNDFKKDNNPPEITLSTDHNIVLASGTIQRVASFPSQYIKPRPVDIWLPENYSKDKKYAVLYMHDGQMLFDATKTWNKQEWKVDEWASKLQQAGKVKDFIVVAPHNISEIRWNDYFPAKAMDYMPEGIRNQLIEEAKKQGVNSDLYADNYLKFLTQELKPFIDKQYSVYTDAENTVVSGSSMGGLISMYAISEYPDIYGAAACISTHWVGARVTDNNPFPPAIFAYMKAHIPSPKTHRIYFDYGNKTLDQYYPQYAPTVDSIMLAKGYDDTNFVNRFFEGTDHSENSWNLRLDVPLTFLLGN